MAAASLTTMKILHTSDWHIGRSFHGNSTVAHLRCALDALTELVRQHSVDVVVVSGDIFDSATPAAEYYGVLTATITNIRAAGAQLILISGNHDSATRLGFLAGFTAASGVHISTNPGACHLPVSLTDRHGPVHFYGIPYLEPSIVSPHFDESPPAALRTHEQVLGAAMNRIRGDLIVRGGRSVVLSHAFIADVAAQAALRPDEAHGQAPDELAAATGSSVLGLERDITSGGLDLVPLSVFDGPDYVALGHIHGRATLSERARYSGAPLHYSFGEARKPRGSWLVELTASGLGSVTWLDLPVPRRLTVLTGHLDELISSTEHTEFEGDWISAILTDQVRPLDAMRRLQARFPFAATLEHRPSSVAKPLSTSYGSRIARQNDNEIVDGFLELVRNGVGASDREKSLIADTILEGSVLGSAHPEAPACAGDCAGDTAAGAGTGTTLS